MHTHTKYVYNHPLMQCYICLDFVEFQILADHTQDVRNWNQGYQYISQDF